MAIIIETCPKCGHDLIDEVICTYPPIPRKGCPSCGWSWEGEPEEVVRVPFGGNSFKDDKLWSNCDIDCGMPNDDCCIAANLNGNVFSISEIDLRGTNKIGYLDMEAAIERIQKYIKD